MQALGIKTVLCGVVPCHSRGVSRPDFETFEKMVPGPRALGCRFWQLSDPDQELPTGTALSKNIKDEAVKPIIIDNICK